MLPQRPDRADIFHANVNGLGIEVRALDADSSVELAKLRSPHSLPMPDTIVLQSAISGFATCAACDVQLARTARSVGLAVGSPNIYRLVALGHLAFKLSLRTRESVG